MIELFKSGNQQTTDLMEILASCDNDAFYFTENNERCFITDEKFLRRLLSKSHHIYYEYDSWTEKKGIILVWKSVGGDTERNYVKVIADSEDTAKRLLTILLWNYGQELYVKIKKDSPFVRVFRSKGFKFSGGRGSEVLMTRNKVLLPLKTAFPEKKLQNVSSNGNNLKN